MNVAVSVGLAFAAIIGVCLFVLWYGSATVIDKHEDRITVMEKWAEQFGGPKPAEFESSPTNAGSSPTVDPGAKTDEFPTLPATQPDGIAIQVQSALLRPSPVPRGKSAEWVERTVNIGGTLQTFRIPAREDT